MFPFEKQSKELGQLCQVGQVVQRASVCLGCGGCANLFKVVSNCFTVCNVDSSLF